MCLTGFFLALTLFQDPITRNHCGKTLVFLKLIPADICQQIGCFLTGDIPLYEALVFSAPVDSLPLTSGETQCRFL